jgi:hypothetical protein
MVILFFVLAPSCLANEDALGLLQVRVAVAAMEDVDDQPMSDDASNTSLEISNPSPCTCAEPPVWNVDGGNWCWLAEGRKETTCKLSNWAVVTDWSWARCHNAKDAGVKCYHDGFKNGITSYSKSKQQPCSNTGSYPKAHNTDIGNTEYIAGKWYTPRKPGCRSDQSGGHLGMNCAESYRLLEASYSKCVNGDYMGPKWKTMCTYFYTWKDNGLGTQPMKIETGRWQAGTFNWGCDPF